MVVLFATSNRGKLDEARMVLSSFGISVEQFDGKGIEIQAETSKEVAAYASRSAARSLKRALLVEDAGLFVEVLNGFPGPYSAYVFKTLGVAGIIQLLEGRPSRKARFVSSVAYCEPAGEPELFEGIAEGFIAAEPRGKRGFGFDPIFVPAGVGGRDGTKTFGELDLEEKCAVSHRGEALKRFAKWYLARASP